MFHANYRLTVDGIWTFGYNRGVARQRKYVFDCDLTQQEIAQRLGTHQPQISRWLNGRDFPRYRNLCRLAAVMGMRPAVLAQHIESESARRQGTQR
jgi:transcriptional regulator with XRE-family HTH domain